MKEEEIDVHTEHCCAIHGCKYIDENCTVYDPIHNRPLKRQSHLCETCDWIRHDRRGPYEVFEHLGEEPAWFTVSETQICIYNSGANNTCVITRLAFIRMLGSQERYKKALAEMYDSGGIILREWFPDKAVPQETPKRWRYLSKNIFGNIHDAACWIDENHPEWDVVAIGKSGENGVTGSVTPVVYRIELR